MKPEIWNTVFLQFVIWASIFLASVLCIWFFIKPARRVCRGGLWLVKVVLPLLLLAFLLALIPNLGMGNNGDRGGGADTTKKLTNGGSENGSPTVSTPNFVLHVIAGRTGPYIIELGPFKNPRKSQIEACGEPEFRRQLAKHLRDMLPKPGDTKSRSIQVITPDDLSDVARRMIEDVLRTEGFEIR